MWVRAQQNCINPGKRRTHPDAHHQGNGNQRRLPRILLDPVAGFQNAGGSRA